MMNINDKPKTQGKMRLKALVLVLLFAGLGFFNFPAKYNSASAWLNNTVGFGIGQITEDPFRLGLDLVGGAHLVYEVDTRPVAADQDVDTAVDGVRDVIERRVNAFGVGEPLVQTNQVGEVYRIIVELPGVENVQEAVDAIGETPLLEFKEPSEGEQEPLTEEEQKELLDRNSEAKQKADDALQALRSKSFEQVVLQYTESETTINDGGKFFITESAFGDNEELLNWAQRNREGYLSRRVEQFEDGFYILRHDGKEEVPETVTASHILICHKESDQCKSKLSKEDALAKAQEIAAQATAENFATLAAAHSNDATGASGGALGTFGRGEMVAAFEEGLFPLAVNEVSGVIESQFGYHIALKQAETLETGYNLAAVYVKKWSEEDIRPPQGDWANTELGGAHLQRALVQFDGNTNEPLVSLQFNDKGKELFAAITEKNLHQPVGIFLDGYLVSAPTVQNVISNGEAIITGRFTITEAKDLAQSLNTGALPLPIELVSEQRVGASLGAESLARSLNAALIGLILVSIFIALYYRLAGVLAVLALLVYSVVVLAIFKVVPVTLTVSGVAGFILSLGLAVDANIIIFERVKEERQDGKRLHQSIEDGFARAWASIRDANISTLITCIILFWFGTSVVKGFALTLSIGVIVSMISAIFVTRFLLRLVIPQLDEKTKAVIGTPRNNA